MTKLTMVKPVETIGYIGRALSAHQNPGPYTLGPFIIQSVLLLVAPALFAASIYMELGRIVRMSDADKALFIRRTWLTKIFVCGDVFSFLMQSSGAGLLASGNAHSAETGRSVIVGGLFLQVIFFGLFVIAAAVFHARLGRAPTAKSYEVPWKRHMISLYVVSLLIFIRSVVRVAEYIQGYSGYIMSHEVYLYVFDALVMFIAVVTMNWIHPEEVATILRTDRATDRAGREEHNKEGVRMDYTAV